MVTKKYVTILIVPHEDTNNPRRLRLAVWLFRTLTVFIILMFIAPVAYIAIYYEVLTRAADAGRLAEENESLRRYQYKVQILEQSLLETRQLMAQITAMAGLDSILLAEQIVDGDSSLIMSETRMSPGSISRTLPPSSPIPDGLPATGWISRGFSDIPGKKHHGVDLAMPEGTQVYATAFGTVMFAGLNAEYGYMIVMNNNDSIETVFGHNSQNLVQVGDTIFAGQKIALSGNTGQSSAPHLHYEIRINGNPVNPLKYFVYENQTK
jgi:murein DD-endopeptidase MepM/ murein hydrolase activator NlpD